MMREVLNRRFKKAVQEKENYLTMPDLVLIDGGKGQYSVARETMNELGLHDIPVIAIAKGKFRNSGNETFFHNGNEYKFEKNDPTLFFLQRIRDEAHRFAISAHRAKKKRYEQISTGPDRGYWIDKKKSTVKPFLGQQEQLNQLV